MSSAASAEIIIIVTPIIALGTAVFNYFYNTFRNDNLNFSIKGFIFMLISAIIYAVLLGVFSYFFYKIVIEYLYSNIKTFIIKTSQGNYEVAASKINSKSIKSSGKKVKSIQIVDTNPK